MKIEEDLNALPLHVLQDNLALARAIADGVAIIASEEHMQRIARSCFNTLVLCLDTDKVSQIDAMKLNMLAHLIDGGLNIEKVQASADEQVHDLLKAIRSKINATPQAD